MHRDWESWYQRGEMPWDRGVVAPPLQELGVAWCAGGPVLVPGCGLGHDVRWLQAQGIAAIGVDLAATAIEQARRMDPSACCDFQVGDFLDPAWQPKYPITAIWEHTCFCAIHPSQRPAYVAACARLLPPGGMLAGVFFLTPEFDPAVDEPPYPSSIEELDAHFAVAFERLQGWVPSTGYPGRVGREWIGVYQRKPA